MNSLKLNIKNFQVIKEACLEFNTGITLLVGASGNGKTSCLRALKCLILNPQRSQSKIKHGENFISVFMDYNGNEVEWRRSKKGSVYNINGTEYSKTGSTNLLKLLEGGDSGFTLDEKNNLLNMEGCWEVLFPYSLSNAELFRLFENIFSVSDSAKIFQMYKQEEDILNKKIIEHSNELNRNTEKIKAIEKLQNSVDIELFKTRREKLLGLDNKFGKISCGIVTVEDGINFCSKLPDNYVSTTNTDKINNYLKLVKNIKDIFLIVKYVKGLRGVEKPSLITFNSVDKYSKIKDSIKNLNNILSYPEIEELDTSPFSKDNLSRYFKVKSTIEDLNQLEQYTSITNSLTPITSLIVDKLERYKKVIEALKTLKAISGDIKKGRSDIEDIKQNISIVEGKLERFKDNICSTCGQLIVNEDKCIV